jgi:hypothetical protein
MSQSYVLLDGSIVDLSGLAPRQVRILREVEARAMDGYSYTDLVASLFHPLSPLWNGQPPRTEVVRGPLLRVLPDLCARIALEQRAGDDDDSQVVPVSEYARIKGVSRQSIYAAAARGEIRLARRGDGRPSAVAVDDRSRTWTPSTVRQAAGRLRGRYRIGKSGRSALRSAALT